MGTWDATGYDDRFGFVTDLGAPLLDLLDARPGERVLDLGCGTGHQAAALAERGCRVVGVDVDPAMLAQARREHDGPGAPTFLRGDAEDPSLLTVLAPHLPFDAVLSNAALHWMPEVDQVLRNLHGVMRAGGRLVAEQGGAGNVERVRGALAAALVDLGVDADEARGAVNDRSWFPTVAQESAALEAAGFEVRQMTLFARPTPLAAGSTVADWAAMFRPWIWGLLPSERQEELAPRIDISARAAGLQHLDDTWWADYVRLRFVAIAR